MVNEHEWLTGTQQCEHDELVGPPKDPDGITLVEMSQHFLVCTKF